MNKKIKDSKNARLDIWYSIRKALWGYSTIMLLILIVLALIPYSGHSNTFGVGLIIIAPIALFLVSIAFEYKRYYWIWWNILLGGYTFFFIILVGIAYFLPHTHSSGHGVDIISALLFLPLFVFFASLKNK